MNQARAPHGFGLAPLVREDGPQHLVQILTALEERPAKHALLDGSKLAQGAVAAGTSLPSSSSPSITCGLDADVIPTTIPTFPGGAWETAINDGWYRNVAPNVDRNA